MKIRIALLLILLSQSSVTRSQTRPPLSKPTNEQRVQIFAAWFNRHDAVAMGQMVTNDVEWLNVDGKNVSVEAFGKPALVDSMERYFKSCATCRSTLASVTGAGSRVTAMETASWDTATGHRQQRALSVYEFEGDLIRRVYYFPAEPIPEKF